MVFGLDLAAYAITKLLRSPIKYWRTQNIPIWIHIDDGLLVSSSKKECLKSTNIIRQTLRKLGLLTSEEKCIWEPPQILTWVGHEIDTVKFNIDTLIPLGLLLNEIISNALKYGFSKTEKGKVTIHLSPDENEDMYKMLIGDNGIGMAMGTLEKEEGSLGMELLKVFVSQLEGSIERLDKKGTYFEIKFHTK